MVFPGHMGFLTKLLWNENADGEGNERCLGGVSRPCLRFVEHARRGIKGHMDESDALGSVETTSRDSCGPGVLGGLEVEGHTLLRPGSHTGVRLVRKRVQ